MQYINMAFSLYEIFEEVKKQESVEEKAKLLRAYDRVDIRWFINMMYINNDKKVRAIEIPDYIHCKEEPYVCYTTTCSCMKAIQTAIQMSVENDTHKQNLAIEIFDTVFSSLNEKDSELLIAAIKGERSTSGLSKGVFKKAYPEFFLGCVEDKENV